MRKLPLIIAVASGILLPSWNTQLNLAEAPRKVFCDEKILQKDFFEMYKPQKTKELEKKIDDFINYRTDDFSEDTDKILLARLMLGEAAGCSDLEKVAVAFTALNRTKNRNQNLKQVILQPYQYSCFNSELDSSIFLKDPTAYEPNEFANCLKISEKIIMGKYKDPTKGATYYFNPQKVKIPSWTRGLIKVGRIGKSYHLFYKERN